MPKKIVKSQKKVTLKQDADQGVIRSGTLTPFLDKLDDLKGRFFVEDDELMDLANTRVSALDLYFMDVADKHGLDLSDEGDRE